MTDDTFTEPTEPAEDWADVRMHDPGESEWEVDMVVDEGHVEYVDLRVRPDLLADFFACLVEDVGDDRAERVLATVADQRGVDLGDGNRGETDDSSDSDESEADDEDGTEK
jgi:hypothetical protein